MAGVNESLDGISRSLSNILSTLKDIDKSQKSMSERSLKISGSYGETEKAVRGLVDALKAASAEQSKLSRNAKELAKTYAAISQTMGGRLSLTPGSSGSNIMSSSLANVTVSGPQQTQPIPSVGAGQGVPLMAVTATGGLGRVAGSQFAKANGVGVPLMPTPGGLPGVATLGSSAAGVAGAAAVMGMNQNGYSPASSGGGPGFLRRAGGLALTAGVAAAQFAYNATPGYRDALAFQSALFPTAFAAAGPYDDRAISGRIRASFGTFMSSPTDPLAAAALFTSRGLGPSSNAFSTVMREAAFGTAMTGMSNPSAAAGVASLQGGSVAGRLASYGIFTNSLSTGEYKGMGDVIDQLWARWFGSKSAKVPLEVFEADLLGGFLGADLRRLFGDQPELYNMIVAGLRLKAKAGGRAGIDFSSRRGKNSATQLARSMGMNETNAPWLAQGQLNESRYGAIDATRGPLLEGMRDSIGIVRKFNQVVEATADALAPLYRAKGAMQAFLDTTEGLAASSALATIIGGLSSALGGLGGGGGGGVDSGKTPKPITPSTKPPAASPGSSPLSGLPGAVGGFLAGLLTAASKAVPWASAGSKLAKAGGPLAVLTLGIEAAFRSMDDRADGLNQLLTRYEEGASPSELLKILGWDVIVQPTMEGVWDTIREIGEFLKDFGLLPVLVMKGIAAAFPQLPEIKMPSASLNPMDWFNWMNNEFPKVVDWFFGTGSYDREAQGNPRSLPPSMDWVQNGTDPQTGWGSQSDFDTGTYGGGDFPTGNARGTIGGTGSSTSDSIPARLSRGEYVINARAAQAVGTETLDAINSMGQSFGSAYASPARNFSKGGSTLDKLLTVARTKIGAPYVAGADGPDQFDCSGFTQWAYNQIGIKLSDVSYTQVNEGQKVATAKSVKDTVSWTQAIPGDLLFFDTDAHENDPSGLGISHVGIYTGNGKMIHAWGPPLAEISLRNYGSPLRAIRRVLSGAPSAGRDNGNRGGQGSGGRSGEGPSAGANLTPRGHRPMAETLGASGEFLTATSIDPLGKLTRLAAAFGRGDAVTDAIVESLGSAARLLFQRDPVMGRDGEAPSSKGKGKGKGTGRGTDSGNYPSGSGGQWLYDYLTARGLTGDTLRVMWSIGMRESGGRPSLVAAGSAGSWTYPDVPGWINWDSSSSPHYDTGMFQINNVHLARVKSLFGPNATMQEMVDPDKNFEVTREISNNFTNLKAWGLSADGRSFDWSSYPSSWLGKYQYASEQNYLSFYNQFSNYNRSGYSQGAWRTTNEIAKIHEGEMIIPANAAEEFRSMMRDALTGSRGGSNNVTINVSVQSASEEEARRLAQTVKRILEDDTRLSSMRRR